MSVIIVIILAGNQSQSDVIVEGKNYVNGYHFCNRLSPKQNFVSLYHTIILVISAARGHRTKTAVVHRHQMAVVHRHRRRGLAPDNQSQPDAGTRRPGGSGIRPGAGMAGRPTHNLPKRFNSSPRARTSATPRCL